MAGQFLSIPPFAEFYLVSQALPHFVDAIRYLGGDGDKVAKQKAFRSMPC